jgi:hypothetical protein
VIGYSRSTITQTLKNIIESQRTWGTNLIESINAGRRPRTWRIGREEGAECRLDLAAWPCTFNTMFEPSCSFKDVTEEGRRSYKWTPSSVVRSSLLLLLQMKVSSAVEDKIPWFWKITRRILGDLISLFVLYIIEEDQKEERGIQNFKSRLCGPEWETKNFGSWTQTLVTQMKDCLGLRPKRQWPYAERQVVDWVLRATMDHGMDKHT